ncbi:hypothetical protein M0805_007725 [Coniferiporia weirii]|nr:hypothetical protein M0805_007725 [Coniferiporia weirii]
MDATDLARWTRFAAKGGIGKCTAVQDCIAESPEDLMFLKDDEITVLMQLQSGAEHYLGYCEGVVGRFQGAHVRFHGKLKRPVMTKRASTSTPSQRSASGSSTPIPSPLVGHASLRTDSPQLPDVSANESTVHRRKTKERVSSVHSDPFDLELEPPPRRSDSLPRPGSNAGSISHYGSNSRPGTAGTADMSDYREAESPHPQGLGDAGSDNDGLRRRTSRVRAGDELPGLEMFLPSASSRSSSRTRVNSALGTSSGSREDSSEPSSRPNSRGQDDEATSAKADRKRVRNLAVTQQLQLLQDQATQSPHASSLDLPPSPLPHSQFTMHSHSSLHTQSPLPSPRFLPPPSPSSLSSPAHSSHFSPSPPPPPSPGKPPYHPQSGGEVHDKPSARPLGADMQIRVDVDVIVRVSPSDMKPLAPTPEPPSISVLGDPQLTSDPLQSQPAVLPVVGANDQSQVVSEPLSEITYEMQLVPAENEGDPEVSSLYDHGSVRSSVYSTQSFNSYASTSPSLSNLGLGRDADESRAESDDNAPGFGIGLSMLQDMADEEEDDDGVEVTVVGNGINGVNGRTSDGEGEVPETPRFPAKSATVGSEKPSTYGEGVGASKVEKAWTHTTDVAEGGTNESRAEGDGEDEPEAEGEELREDDSDYGDDDDDDYWDGADIYDNYRYSRYSVMTRASRRKSRYSVQSKYSLADFEAPPPVPADARASPSPVPTFTSTHPGALGSPLEERKRRIPAPLTLVKSNSVSPPISSSPGLLSPTYNATAAAGHPLGSELSASRPTTSEYGLSPLLHTNFPSPQTSSSRVTSFGSNSGSGSGHDHGISLPSPSPGAIPSSSADNFMAAGAASTLRQRLENDREADPMSPSVSVPLSALPSTFMERMDSQDRDSVGHGRGIVVEDDEGVSVTVVPADTGDISGKDYEDEDDDESGDKDRREHGKESNGIRESLQSVASEASYATSTSVISDVSKEMRQIEADLAAATVNSPTLANPSAGLHPPVDSLNEQRTPTAAGFSMGPTQPLRIDRTGIRVGPSQEQPTQPATMPLVATQQQPQQQPPVRQQQAPPAATHLRPQLPSQEQALFLPHPNAPRPNPAVLSGQRVSTYGMPPVHEPRPVAPPSSPTVPAHGSSQSLQATLRMAAAARVGPAGVPHHATIFGKPIIDLASSDGPVAMVWSLQPFPLEPTSRSGTPVGGRAPRRAATAGAAPSPLRQDVVVPVPEPQRVDSPLPLPTPAPVGAQMAGNGSRGPSVLSRSNFSPQVGTSRPRSRSFSGFASDLPMKPEPKERASEEGSRPSRTASFQSLKDAATALVKGSFTSPTGHSARQSPVSVSNSGRGAHAPSPLSHPRNNTVLETPNAASPLSRPPNLSEQTTPESNVFSDGAKVSGVTPPQPPNGRMFGLRQVASFGALKSERPESPLTNPPSVFQPVRRNSGQAESASAGVSHPSTAPSAMGRLRRISSSSSGKKHQRTVSQLSHASSSSDIRSITVSPPPLASESASSSASPPMQRSNSVKSKLSLSHLRIRNGSAKDALTEMQTPSPSTGPATPVFEFDNQPETVQVQDAEFEMIRPMMRRVSSEPTSDDSVLGREERPSLQSDARAASPAASSLRSARSLIPGALTESLAEVLTPRGARPAETESAASVEAHRARELRWIAAMAAVPAAQARKNKKIRRLVLEGVPASVRYLVWAHLTDSKSRHMPGMYGVLGRRGRVAAADAIEHDAVGCFTGQPHLQDAKGPLVSMLQTYLTMVPDIEYQTNLALIAGHLLLQSPEEDAFWTFVSMMDLHLRAYFSPKSVQMEADAMVFGKAVESVHPQLAKKLFVDMAIHPLELCRIWFSSLFTSSLPLDYANRIWDVYLCDGPPFLFRVGLALLSSCRSSLEAARDRSSAISVLTRPDGLPTDPEALINAALATRLRDDDVRKQRTKLEAQLKRQTQNTQRAGSAPRLMSSISLPRTGV